MRVQLTDVEKLDIKHPGLRIDVDTMLNQGVLLEEIQALLRTRYQETISHQTLSRYKQKRWLPSVQRIEDRVERSQAVIRVIKKEGDTDFARAYIFEQLDEAARRGDRIDPAVLLREQRLRMELQLRFEELQQTERKLELGIKRAALELDTATRGASKMASGSSLSIDAINAIRERTFGLPPIGPDGAEPRAFDPEDALRKISAVIGVGGEPEERVEGHDE